MAITFNESSVWAEALAAGVKRRRLLTAARVPGTKIHPPGTRAANHHHEGASICTWLPTGRNIRGEQPVREIKGHSSAVAVPQDV